MYQDSEQDIVVPVYQAFAIDQLQPEVRGMNAIIHLGPEEKMNYVLGATWALFKDFSVLVDYGGFAERKQWLLQATIRF